MAVFSQQRHRRLWSEIAFKHTDNCTHLLALGKQGAVLLSAWLSLHPGMRDRSTAASLCVTHPLPNCCCTSVAFHLILPTSRHLQIGTDCSLFPRLPGMESGLGEAHSASKSINYPDGFRFPVTSGAFLPGLSVLEAPCVPPRQQIWTLRDPEPALSQHQHPPLSRRQTSGGQTPLPCNSPRCFLSLFNAFTFCFQLFPCHT